VIVHFVDIGGIVGHLNLRVLFKAIQQLSIDKYNLSLEKGTNIKKQHHHTNNKCMSSKETKQIEHNNRSFLENMIHYYGNLETAQ
jgi:hypothetical protein